MKERIADALRGNAYILQTKRKIWSHFELSALDVVSSFPAFAPNSAGRYRDRALLTIQTINQTFPLMRELSIHVGNEVPKIEDIKNFPKSEAETRAVGILGGLLVQYGSDKTDHGYHHLYGSLLSDSEKVDYIFEIGLGTNNTDVVSTMGRGGRPGASLRAFRDLCPSAELFGADIDDRILFSEERINTFYIDQTDTRTFDPIRQKTPVGSFDLVIDDGLHSPNANIASLDFALELVKAGGWAVIEDIPRQASALWQVIASMLPAARFDSHILAAKNTLVFAVKKLV